MPCNHESEIAQLRATLAQVYQQLEQAQQQKVTSDSENQQLISTINQLEKALQISKDNEVALKLQLSEAQKQTQSSTTSPLMPQENLFGSVFQPIPPSSAFLSATNQKRLSYAEQVAAASEAVKTQINPKKLTKLLKQVTKGHLVKVEKLLKSNSSLGLGTETVTDLSDRTFKDITALQYAAWALDVEMVLLIIKYVGADHSAVQLNALAESPQTYSKHGASYDYLPLVNNYPTYFDNYWKWNSDQLRQYWQKKIGGEQRKCPAWLIYAWSEEGADVAWTKQDPHRKITRQYDQHPLASWFRENYNNTGGRVSFHHGQR